MPPVVSPSCMKKKKVLLTKTYLMARTSAGLEYSSEETRNAIIQEGRAGWNSRTLYEWQLDTSEAMYLGLDCTVLAGTASAKQQTSTLYYSVKLLATNLKLESWCRS